MRAVGSFLSYLAPPLEREWGQLGVPKAVTGVRQVKCKLSGGAGSCTLASASLSSPLTWLHPGGLAVGAR